MPTIAMQPRKGEIWKVKIGRSGRTWLFESAWEGHEQIAEHQGAYCYDSNGDILYDNHVSDKRGMHVGDNNKIELLIPANINEIAIFKRKLRR